MEKEKLIEIIKNNYTHKDYDRVVKLESTYRAFITDEGLGKRLRQFVKREDSLLFKQRCELTHFIVRPILNSVISVYNKIYRSTGIEKHIGYKDAKDTTKIETYKSIIDKYYNEDDIDAYLINNLTDDMFIDPNAWNVTEFEPTDGSKYAQPYPFYVSSAEAVDFEHKNGVLQYLVVKNKFKGDKKPLNKYTIYTANRAVQFIETEEDFGMVEMQEKEVNGFNYIKIDRVVYQIVEPTPYNIGFVPAKRYGYIKDNVTKKRTYINPFDHLVPVLDKMLKVTSEMDLTLALHVFAQKYSYSPKCKAPDCYKGTNTTTGNVCGVCKGLGVITHKASHDVIEFPMPDNPQDLFDLSKLVHYSKPDIDLIKLQMQIIDELTAFIKDAAFNSDILTKKQVSDTATGRNIELQNVYDTLYPAATFYAEMWAFINKACAKITGLDKNFYVFTKINRDFKLKGWNDLMIDLDLCVKSGAGEAITRAIMADIARQLFIDSDIQFAKYKTKEFFEPFVGKTAEQIMLIIASLPNNDYFRILWTFFGDIFDYIELKEGEEFYFYTREKQQQIVDAKVKELQLEYKPAPTYFNLPERP